MNMKKLFVSFVILISLSVAFPADAHRSGCHRWHSCPSDSGSYSCGDAGHPCSYPTYPASGGVVYPSSGVYKDCYDCAWKTVPSSDSRLWKSTLSKGSSGSSVTNLQKALITEGVLTQEATGYYGASTEAAVKLFQSKYSIVNSGTPSSTGYGRVGWATLAKLNAMYTAQSDFSSLYSKQNAVNCPINSHQSSTNSKCDCDSGFQPNSALTACVTSSTVNDSADNTQSCKNSFGAFSIWNGTKATNGSLNCSCQTGYNWNSSNTACVAYMYTPPPISNQTTGENYFKTNKTCVGLAVEPYSYCITYSLNN